MTLEDTVDGDGTQDDNHLNEGEAWSRLAQIIEVLLC